MAGGANRLPPLFQNADDLGLVAASSRRLSEQAILTRGSGVDLKRFAPCAESGALQNGTKRVLFADRLIREKGIYEFLEAGRICKRNGVDVELVVCGDPDPGNPSSISLQELSRFKEEGLFQFLGHVDDIDRQIAKSDVVVLPSYREGTPRVLLEAAAMGKAIVASDVPGCREVTVDGENGLLVPVRDSAALASALQCVLTDDDWRQELGRAGRRRMVKLFNERDVINQTLQIYADSTQPIEEPRILTFEEFKQRPIIDERRRAA